LVGEGRTSANGNYLPASLDERAVNEGGNVIHAIETLDFTTGIERQDSRREEKVDIGRQSTGAGHNHMLNCNLRVSAGSLRRGHCNLVNVWWWGGLRDFSSKSIAGH
jgi:hypothetical protein